MRDYRKLLVWGRARRLVGVVYSISADWPESERFGLVSQVRRAAVSIPSNIAEGSGRQTDREFVRFLRVAYGSSCELETQLLVASDLGFVRQETVGPAIAETEQIRRMLFRLAQTIARPKADG